MDYLFYMIWFDDNWEDLNNFYENGKKVDFLLVFGKWGSGIIIFKSFYGNGSV